MLMVEFAWGAGSEYDSCIRIGLGAGHSLDVVESGIRTHSGLVDLLPCGVEDEDLCASTAGWVILVHVRVRGSGYHLQCGHSLCTGLVVKASQGPVVAARERKVLALAACKYVSGLAVATGHELGSSHPTCIQDVAEAISNWVMMPLEGAYFSLHQCGVLGMELM